MAGCGAAADATFADAGAVGTCTFSIPTARAEPDATRIRTARALPSHTGSEMLPGAARRASALPTSGPPSGTPTDPALDQRPRPSCRSMVNVAVRSPCHRTPTRSTSPVTTFDQPGATVRSDAVSAWLDIRTGGGVLGGVETVGRDHEAEAEGGAERGHEKHPVEAHVGEKLPRRTSHDRGRVRTRDQPYAGPRSTNQASPCRRAVAPGGRSAMIRAASASVYCRTPE